MLEAVDLPNSLRVYRSRRLHDAGIAHGFSTRLGGVSAPPFDAMNLGNPSTGTIRDSQANLDENHRRLFAAIGVSPRVRLSVHQVHADAVVVHEGGDWPDPQPQADAIVSTDPTAAATVRTADCVPILLAGRDGRVVAAVHAGWRGTIAGVVASTVNAMRKLGVVPETVLAAIGPAISVDHFEVGPEVAESFDDAVKRRGRADRWHVDLPLALERQLREMGIAEVDRTDRCTFEHACEFHSHRRDAERSGRQAAAIVARAGG